MRRIVCILALIVLPTASVFARQTVPTTAPPQTPPPARPAQGQPAGQPPATTPPVHPGGVPVTPVQGRPATTPPTQAPQTQQTPQTPPPVRPVTVQPSNRDQASSWQNIRVDVTINDQVTPDTLAKKTVTLLVLDGRAGQVRSSGPNSSINVDAVPMIRPDGRIYLQLTLEYLPDLPTQMTAVNNVSRTSFNESLSIIVQDGKSLTVSQSTDPRSDRKVTVDVTATVVK
jgi:hypothetical protein